MQLRLARTMSGGVEANLAGEEGVGDQPTDEDGHDDGSDNLAQQQQDVGVRGWRFPQLLLLDGLNHPRRRRRFFTRAGGALGELEERWIWTRFLGILSFQ